MASCCCVVIPTDVSGRVQIKTTIESSSSYCNEISLHNATHKRVAESLCILVSANLADRAGILGNEQDVFYGSSSFLGDIVLNAGHFYDLWEKFI